MDVGIYVSKIIVTAAAKKIFSSLRASIKDHTQTLPTIETHIETHLQAVLSWSERLQFYGMSAPEPTQDVAVGLGFDVPRRFRGPATKGETFGEDALIQNQEHYLLLGDPGSGKTTTLKRIALKILAQTSVAEGDIYQYPIVIRLRELSSGDSLYTFLASILGIKYQVLPKNPYARNTMEVIEYQNLVDGLPIESVIPQVLNATQAIILLDGLDEVGGSKRESLEMEIRTLVYSLHNSKVILSARSGEFLEHFDGFSVLELCPLTNPQIELIASKWLNDSEQFVKLLRDLPYQDLADRPLFLSQLLLLYKRYGYLPEQPCTVYDKVLRLMLEEWDAQRGIMRKSKYSGFNPTQKIGFLAALSYHLTYKSKKKTFSSFDLKIAYLAVCDDFRLPKDESEEVVNEIETHTGIIVRTADMYEFSHLSLQEYLAAYFIVRSPFSELIGNYIREYPSPLAISVALSSTPSQWFSELILQGTNFSQFKASTCASFVTRLISERPIFVPASSLGLAILKLVFAYGINLETNIGKALSLLLEYEGIMESVARSLTWYVIDPKDNRTEANHIYLKKRFGMKSELNFETPEGGLLPTDFARELVKNYSAKLCIEKTPNSLVLWEDI